MRTQIELPGHLWQSRVKEEENISYDIPHSTRRYIQGAYGFARSKDQPFNILLRYEFKRQGTRMDVKDAREVAQYVRVQLAHMKVDCNLIWSRNVAWGSEIEEVCILTHVPQKHIKNFIDLARGWRDGLDVHLVGYGDDYEFKGQQCNVLDAMLRACDSETICKDLSTLTERSDLIYGYRVWSSWNLKPEHRNKFRKSQNSNETTLPH